jgi:hypothetical protein
VKFVRRAFIFVARELAAAGVAEFGRKLGEHLGDRIGRKIDPDGWDDEESPQPPEKENLN